MIDLKCIAGVVLALGLSTNANAAITVFTDQASFLAATSNPGLDTFSDLPPATSLGSMNRTAGAYSYTVSSPSGLFTGQDSNTFLSNEDRAQAITFDGFGPTVSAVGGLFFGNNVAGQYAASPSITLSVTDADGLFTYALLTPTKSSFLGFVSTGGLSQFTVSTIGQPVWPSVDNFTLAGAASAVPEPATWAMMIIGFGAAGSMVRASRRRNAFSTSLS